MTKPERHKERSKRTNAEVDEPSILERASSTVSGLSRCNERRLAPAFDTRTARESQGMDKPPGQKGCRHPDETEEKEVEDEDGSATQLSSLFGQALLMSPALHLI